VKIALAIEGSNTRGMGHVFRSLLYVQYLKSHNIDFVYLINDDSKTIDVLKKNNIDYILVNYSDIKSNWEADIIHNNGIDVWFNDKFETSLELERHIHEQNILFACLDDVGAGAVEADLYFAGMIYPSLEKPIGKKYYSGTEYVTLNPEIDFYKKKRKKLKRIVISMGGSDPHEVTIDLVKELKSFDYDIDIVIGPNFKKKRELEMINGGRFHIYQNIPSLIEFFSHYDLAITGGGVTCCEANAAGLPCFVIANAPHEINTGKWLEEMGGCKYLGNYENWSRDILKSINSLELEKMSIKGMKNFDTKAIERIFSVIKSEVEK